VNVQRKKNLNSRGKKTLRKREIGAGMNKLQCRENRRVCEPKVTVSRNRKGEMGIRLPWGLASAQSTNFSETTSDGATWSLKNGAWAELGRCSEEDHSTADDHGRALEKKGRHPGIRWAIDQRKGGETATGSTVPGGNQLQC